MPAAAHSTETQQRSEKPSNTDLTTQREVQLPGLNMGTNQGGPGREAAGMRPQTWPCLEPS